MPRGKSEELDDYLERCHTVKLACASVLRPVLRLDAMQACVLRAFPNHRCFALPRVARLLRTGVVNALR